MAVLLANIILAIPFLFAFIAVPLWMTFKRPELGTDHTEARRYLQERAALLQAAQDQPARDRASHTTAA